MFTKNANGALGPLIFQTFFFLHIHDGISYIYEHWIHFSALSFK